MTIRTRLALLFGAAALALLVGGGVLFVSQLQAGLNRSLTGTLRTRADNLSNVLGDASPATGLDRRALRGDPGGTFAQLLGADGHLIAGARLLAPRPILSRTETQRAQRHTLIVDRQVALAADADRGTETMQVLARRLDRAGDVLVVAVTREVVDEAVTRARRQFVLLGVAVLVLAGPGAWLLTAAALRPVERMRREVQALEASDDRGPLRVPRTRDEIARLAETFNVVLARMHAAVAHEQALVADAGHELRTPLTVLKGELELARRPHRTPEELAAAVEVAAVETDRLVRLTDDLLFLSREDERGPRPEPFDVVGVVRSAIDAMAGPAQRRQVRILLSAGEPVTCAGDQDGIRRAVDNLLTNALRHAPEGSAVAVSVTDDEDCVRVTVRDEGAGFPPEFLPVAFDRFTRADDARGRGDETEAAGAGLGLAIVRSIMVRHGGRATAGNRPDGGAEVTLRWPCQTGTARAGARPAQGGGTSVISGAGART